jgi:hypothetical protein
MTAFTKKQLILLSCLVTGAKILYLLLTWFITHNDFSPTAILPGGLTFWEIAVVFFSVYGYYRLFPLTRRWIQLSAKQPLRPGSRRRISRQGGVLMMALGLLQAPNIYGMEVVFMGMPWAWFWAFAAASAAGAVGWSLYFSKKTFPELAGGWPDCPTGQAAD